MNLVENGAVIVGITQVLKGLGIQSNFLPLAALIIGVLLVIGQKGFSIAAIIEGVSTGLVSTGLVNKTNEFRKK